jgi:hypothetical protein
MRPETWVAIYAAIVGTGALLLNFKGWFDSGVRLHLSLMENARIIGGSREEDEADLLALTVTNRGGSPTTITHMVILEFPSLWRRYRLRPQTSFFIPNPAAARTPYQIPYLLEPSKLWTGIAHKRADKVADLHDGNHYVGIYASHRTKPYLLRIPPQKAQLPEGTQPL